MKKEMEEIDILHGQKEREKRRDEESVTQWDMSRCLEGLLKPDVHNELRGQEILWTWYRKDGCE